MTMLVFGTTAEDVVKTFNDLSIAEVTHNNWDGWPVSDRLYINGVAMTMDFDFIMGYLLEVVDRPSGSTIHMVVVRYYGRAEDGTFETTHSIWGDGLTVENVDRVEIGQWAVAEIHRMVRDHNRSL